MKNQCHRPKAVAAFAGFVDLAVGACGERFQIGAQRGLRGKGGDPAQIGGDFLIEKMKSPGVLEREPPIGIRLHPGQDLIEFCPGRALGSDEAGKVDDHGNTPAFMPVSKSVGVA